MCDNDDYIDLLLNMQKKWNEFVHELTYSNRFFPKHPILNDIDALVRICAGSLDESTFLYRAREYEMVCYTSSNNGIKEETDYSEPVLNTLLVQSAGANRWNSIKNDPLFTSLIKKKTETSEWGYPKSKSGKPDPEKAVLNRASPRYISYLYLASDINTALAETRALMNQPFSVAQYKIAKPVHIVNLSFVLTERSGLQLSKEEYWLFQNMSLAFSTPSQVNDKDYIVSQYISEFVKDLGYEGIAYDSSQRRGGINFALFSDKSCEFIKSEIYKVDDIEIKSVRVLPPDEEHAKPK